MSRSAVALALSLTLGCSYGGKPLSPPAPPPAPRLPALEKQSRDALQSLGYLAGEQEFDTESYPRIQETGFQDPLQSPLSTFSVDVDTAAYANVRRFLRGGSLPPADAVRIEELVNSFRYAYPEPEGEHPLSLAAEEGPCPWQPEHRLVAVGLRARSVDRREAPPHNLVFLLDVSGSMNAPSKLPLLKQSMGLLLDTLRPQDRVAIVVYAGAAGLVLPSTPGNQKATIRAALSSLEAGGSTAGGAGIQLAYQVAAEARAEGGMNRVILATDGDFNVGISSPGALSRLVEEKRKLGIALTVLGFGMGNLKDSTLEQLAQSGDGNYAYIDDLAEARKVLVAEGGGTLVTVAKDVKVQVEFNPQQVAGYRLIGYENRRLEHEDFDDDRKDAGDVGSGHTVTALYEIVPRSQAAGERPLRYQAGEPTAAARSGELLSVKVRYQQPAGDAPSKLLQVAVQRGSQAPSEDFRFAAAVAEAALLLRGSEHRGTASWGQVIESAERALGRDPEGYRQDFLELARRAAELADAPLVTRN